MRGRALVAFFLRAVRFFAVIATEAFGATFFVLAWSEPSGVLAWKFSM
jgi:hypothetical protein